MIPTVRLIDRRPPLEGTKKYQRSLKMTIGITPKAPFPRDAAAVPIRSLDRF
jgi:hypothetical protein